MQGYYFQLTCYDISNLELQEPNKVEGPFETAEKRQAVLDLELGSMDLETSYVVSIALLAVREDGVLISEESYVASPEDYPPIEGSEDEEDEDEE